MSLIVKLWLLLDHLNIFQTFKSGWNCWRLYIWSVDVHGNHQRDHLSNSFLHGWSIDGADRIFDGYFGLHVVPNDSANGHFNFKVILSGFTAIFFLFDNSFCFSFSFIEHFLPTCNSLTIKIPFLLRVMWFMGEEFGESVLTCFKSICTIIVWGELSVFVIVLNTVTNLFRCFISKNLFLQISHIFGVIWIYPCSFDGFHHVNSFSKSIGARISLKNFNIVCLDNIIACI